ncbi:hypothetical protein [Pseudonocardia humida]|uniref:Poly-beta-hydroxybutyrate polymerase N-terminal domain-containing protein n=1 Tax=Pseudonocardia humida TaxID=2800819 RepID=A0ABT1ACX8_9PSEU|nr:hypothetical protein [Pseudonocardia humida]MCO1660469.1 hypothetical protein [Pseudonocardia humida]
MTERAALAGLDALAVDPPLAGGPPPPQATVPAGPLLRLAAGLAGRPLVVGRRGAALAGRLLHVGLGTAEAEPGLPPNPALRRLVQAHRAGRATAGELIADAGLDRADRDRLDAVLTAVDDLVEAVLPGTLAPSPAPARPRTARRTPVVGEEVAATPGAVVLRTPSFELIQYLPRTETVRAVPVLLVPSLTNRHYLTDLAPGRSLAEHLVAGGQQVLALSWWNPRAEHADRGLDAYARALLDAVDAVERITRAPSVSLVATGSGGTITAVLLAHLVAAGSTGRAATLTLLLPAFGRPDPPAPLPAAGPSPELRAWANDTIRLPAALHDDLTGIAARDALAHPGAVRVLGTPIDLSKVDTDAYVVAGDGGPWSAAYRSSRLLAGDTRFVLASGGPVEALVAPPGSDRSFRAAQTSAADPDAWYPTAPPAPGSWWTDHLRWLDARSGARVDAPPELGGRGLHAVAPTPGDYVSSR